MLPLGKCIKIISQKKLISLEKQLSLIFIYQSWCNIKHSFIFLTFYILIKLFCVRICFYMSKHFNSSSPSFLFPEVILLSPPSINVEVLQHRKIRKNYVFCDSFLLYHFRAPSLTCSCEQEFLSRWRTEKKRFCSHMRNVRRKE